MSESGDGKREIELGFHFCNSRIITLEICAQRAKILQRGLYMWEVGTLSAQFVVLTLLLPFSFFGLCGDDGTKSLLIQALFSSPLSFP